MNLAGISFRDLEYVVAVATEQSFVKAARQCAVSQPSLSAQVQKVEQWLGVRIFERTSRKVIVTEAGRAFVKHAGRVLAEARQLRAAVPSPDQPFGVELRLSAISTLGPYLFPRLLGSLRTAYPGLRFMLGEGMTEQLLADLLAGELDGILISPPFDESGVVTSPLFNEPFLLACPETRAFAASPEDVWTTLPGDERLLLETGHCLRHQALDMCATPSASNRQGTSLETLKYMVAAGEGCTIVPALAAREVENLRYVELRGERFSRTIALAWRASDPRRAYFEALAMNIRDSAGSILPGVSPIAP
ncbi:LysR substrate-binding domain-containing protein [Sphingomonas sp. PR090111-T3T-6A]|uniref:LysR substrate-binding domain-containing protein n=1 Tax=Sphingomonas sp. PR090111-T3T-6A TaxID=685778 RepID=UPI00035EB451|nr:LysR substrate-binding domain-containing protein [Sphingomonas sp. PR090111-T3T-6A]